MTDTLIAVKPEIAAKALIDGAKYNAMYAAAAKDPEGFWRQEANRIAWMKAPTRIKDVDFGGSSGRVSIKWYEDGVLNASVSCLDRHLDKRGDQVAIIWEGDDPSSDGKVTYRELHGRVCQLANALRKLGVRKGDRVCIYLPMIVEAAVAMLACARVGAVHSIVFGGFSPDSLASRIQDSECTVVLTADEGRRGGRKVPLKANTDEALKTCASVRHVVVAKNTGGEVPMQAGRDHWWSELCDGEAKTAEPEPMGAEDPLFILYTSGSTGKPKGVLHTTGGYMVWASFTHQYVFDYQEGETYWCTADVGWVTGHTYIVYGPLANGATTLMFEGVPNYPGVDRFWQVIDKHQVNIFYTAPTAIRSLMREGEAPVRKHARKTLRVLGSVGEPINPEAWLWYYRVVGDERCPIVDTWWQTETGGILISPLPGAIAQKPGSATLPLPGISADVVDDQGQSVPNGGGGYLVLREPWPSMLRTIWGDDQRFIDTYWSRFESMYFAGDGAKKDDDGAVWLLGRVDDVMLVSGHNISTTEVESALVSHPSVAEAAVVGATDPTTGQAIVAFTIPRGSTDISGEAGEKLIQELRQHVAKKLGPIAKPRQIMLVPELPKTRSGKIMRRLLRDVAENRSLGDVTTLQDSAVMDLISSGLQSGKSED